MHRILAVLLLLGLTAPPISAQTVLRDAGLEHALSELARPLLAVAGLQDPVRILVIDDARPNIFAANDRVIVLHAGLLRRLQTVDQARAVIAHEIAHIAEGHAPIRVGVSGHAATPAGFGVVLGAATASSDRVRAKILAHDRDAERSADARALRDIAAIGAPALSARRIMAGISRDLFRTGQGDLYASLHPDPGGLPARETTPQTGKPDDGDGADWLARARATASALTDAPRETLRDVGGRRDALSTLRAAIARHRQMDPSRALAGIGRLLAQNPSDAYLHALKGRFLLESGRAASAVESYRRAERLAPGDPLIRARLGRAILATGRPRDALVLLEAARAADPYDPGLLQDLATALAQNGEPALALVALAERAALLGRFGEADRDARRAEGLLQRNTEGWRRARDVRAITQPH
ncbi:M48 family metalloprotease [uncultured Jannaschia sp.]|uniref:M48 family metalloprotease n=1 Tax=uncultured Jannaschia sp. TaxID=293347 RepID=UPI0026326316|nr:M48 family metalloprotease [uncultured Jannaschia sp.]